MDQCTKQILHAGCQAIIVKKGKAGSSIYTNKKHVHLTGYPNDEVVDPVGAGDGFAAGFISGLIDSKSIEEAVDRGNLVGSMVTMVKGDCERLPYREELNEFLHGKSDIKR